MMSRTPTSSLMRRPCWPIPTGCPDGDRRTSSAPHLYVIAPRPTTGLVLRKGGPRARRSRPLHTLSGAGAAMHEVSRRADELILHEDNIWVRLHTYDKQIVRESRQYLRLQPGARDVLLDIGANIGCVRFRVLQGGG